MSTGSLVQGEVIAERYQVTRLIGRGGMGEVYEAWDLLLKEDVALKTLRADLTHKESVVQRFQKEIHLARKVTHPSVCRIFEVGVRPADSRRPRLLFFAMELLKGETLSSRIQKGKLTRTEAFPIAMQLAEGLEAAHRARVVHSDFKSGNIILVPRHGGVRAVITDFGLARLDPNRTSSDQTATETQDMQLAGTVATMSPEQMTGGVITAASDIYSFGIVLFEMATGSLPFHDRHLIQSAMQRGDSQSISVRSKVPDIDPRWEAAIAKCLQKDPANRFASVGEIANWFREGAGRNPRYWTRREWIRNSAAAVITVSAGTGGWIWWHRPYQPLPEASKWFKAGEDALHSMTYETAKKRFLEAVANDPRFALAHASLARAYDELDSKERANDSMMRAVTISKEVRLSSDDARKLEAMRLMLSRDYEHALPLFKQNEVRANRSERPAAALETGWLAQQHEESEAAESAYERAFKWDPSYAAAKLRLAYIYGRALKDEMALKLFKEAEYLYKARTDSEGVTETLFQRASLLNRRNRSAEAMPVIEEALKQVSADSPYQEIRLKLLKSVVSGKQQNTVLAVKLAQEAINRAEDEDMESLATGGLLDLGSIYLRLRPPDLKSAQDNFEEGLKRSRDKWPRTEARARVLLATLYEIELKPKKAREFAEAALPFYSQAGYRRELVQASGIRGYALSQLGEYDLASQVLNGELSNANRLKPDLTQLLERIAFNLRNQGEWPKALQEFEELAKLYDSPGSKATALLNCADIKRQLGRRVEAESTIEDVKKLAEGSKTLLKAALIQHAEIAYADADFTGVLSLAQNYIPGEDTSLPGELRIALLAALARIQLRQGSGGWESAKKVIEAFDDHSLVGEAASARQSIAEALCAARSRPPDALRFVGEALEFFAPRKVWEAVFRGNLVAARLSQDHSDIKNRYETARSSLAELRASWTPADVESYLARREIKQLSQGIHL